MSPTLTKLAEPHTRHYRSTKAVVPAEEGWRRGTRTVLDPPAARRVLVVETNVSESEALVRGLVRHGHQVVTAATGAAALRAYADVELVLLDLELPDLDGLEICRGIRAACDVPVIAVTARGTELDRVLGLQAGADDYLEKPYGFRELMARIDAVMRRIHPRPQARRTLSHGPLRVDADTREVALDGRRIDLTRKEFDLLYLLATNAETVIPRKRLMLEVWGDSWSRRTVDTHVGTLRNKLGAGTWVLTVRGIGYRLGHG